MDDEEFSLCMAGQHQEEMARMSSTVRPSLTPLPKNSSTIKTHESLSEYIHKDVRVSLNSYVELQDGDFMKIMNIERTPLSEITIRGYIYRRTRELNGLLNHKLNEVCWVLHIVNNDPRDPSIQGMQTRGVSEVIRRRHTRVTNLAFPALSFRDDAKETEETITNYRALVCRYKYIYYYPDSQARSKYAWYEKGIHRIRACECDKRLDSMTTEGVLRFEWRGNTEIGGEQPDWLPVEREFLHQEAISNQGKKIRQSLRGPNLDFAIGDPMQRYNVATIVKKSDLRGTPLGINGLAELASPPTHVVEQQKRPRSRHPQRDPYTEASQTVKIDAHVKTSTDLGTLQAHYKSKITSSFVPRPRKRRADLSLHTFSRPVKRSSSQSSDVQDLFQRPSSHRQDIRGQWCCSDTEDPDKELKTGDPWLSTSFAPGNSGVVESTPYLHRSEPSSNRIFNMDIVWRKMTLLISQDQTFVLGHTS